MERGLHRGWVFFFCGVFFVVNFAAARQHGGSFARTYSNQIHIENAGETSYVWQERGVFPFNELIVSWNALRPAVGKYTFWVRVKGTKWSNWIRFAEWSVTHQQTFSYAKDEVAQVKVAALTLKHNCLATEFEVKVESSGGADLSNVHRFYACASNLDKYENIKPSRGLVGGFVEDVPQQSQMVLPHARAKDMCSPTATSTALRLVLEKIDKTLLVDCGKRHCGAAAAVDFAALAYDDGHNIYGNWVLNVAAAYDVSEGTIPCRVERLASFDALYNYLRNDRPVVVSVQGPLRGGALPYAHGHLMVVIGWDAKKRRVLCIDSAFRSNKRTKVWYDSDEFCKAWGRRKNLSYVFMPLS